MQLLKNRNSVIVFLARPTKVTDQLTDGVAWNYERTVGCCEW
jgi:hypothetical protein